MRKTNDEEQIRENNTFNIVDVLLLDHEYLKECIEVLKDEDSEPRAKMKYARGFLDALKKHSEGEKKALYAALENYEDVRFEILEAEVEHGIVDQKVKMLTDKIAHKQVLDDQLEAEMKVLAELVEHHVQEEEEELLPKLRRDLPQELLNQMGFQFMTIRQFTSKDLRDEPELKKVVPMIRRQQPMSQAIYLKETKKQLHA